MKNLSIVGSTGSVGTQTLSVIRDFPESLRVIGLAAGNNTALLSSQSYQFLPKLVSANSRRGLDVPPGTRIVDVERIVTDSQVGLVVMASTASAGRDATLQALRAGKEVALASKEVLVTAGHLVSQCAIESGVDIRPVDSEHSAIWQCLAGEDRSSVDQLIITASGGAFRDHTLKELATVTPEQALAHPTWSMGKKITVDSATLVNKAFEVIEARWLFDVPFDSIQVVLHRQSIIHSMVQFVDGSVKAQMGKPDMRIPIQYAIFGGAHRLFNEEVRYNPTDFSPLTFEELDLDRYPCYTLVLEAGKKQGTFPAVAAAVDEIAVELFLSDVIPFQGIAQLLSEVLGRHSGRSNPSLEEIIEAERWAKETALECSKLVSR